MTMVAAIALMTTGATIALGLGGGKGISDPIILAALELPGLLKFFVLAAFMLAMFVVNVFANSIAPGYDIANTYSKYLTWFRGIVIGVVISAALGAWTFYASGAYGFIYNWLLVYGALLGGVEGVLIFDYAVIRRFKFEAVDVYLSRGRFRYLKGFNPAAFIAFAFGTTVTYLWYWGWLRTPTTQFLYVNSWISAFLITGVLYVVLMVLWVIPKYQVFLIGDLKQGYMSAEVRKLFNPGSKKD